MDLNSVQALTTRVRALVCSRELFHITLYRYSVIGIWWWSLALTIEVPFLAPYLVEREKLGALLILARGLSAAAVLLVPLFTRKGILFGCYACGILGTVFGIILAFAWKWELPEIGFLHKNISIGFFTTVFVLSGLDSIRFVLFMMYAQQFGKKHYITVNLIGSEFGAWVIALLILIQKQFGESSSDELVKNRTFNPTVISLVLTTFYFSTFAVFGFISQKLQPAINEEYETIPASSKNEENRKCQINDNFIFSYQITIFILWYFVSAFACSGMHSLHSYTALPYGQSCFKIAVAFWGISIPTSVIFAHYFTARKITTILLVVGLYYLNCLILIFIAFRSPNPPGADSEIVAWMVVLLWFFQGFIGYYLNSICSYNLAQLNDLAIKNGAMISQFGSLAGSILSFTVINLDIFEAP